MDIGLIGLEFSGKTTVFRAITKGSAHQGSFGGLEPSIGVVKLPDDRLDRLSALYDPKKITYVEARFLDFPGGFVVGNEGPAAAHLAAISQCDALMLVVRGFESDGLPRTVDAHRDISDVNIEMMFADSATLERRRKKLEENLRSGKSDDKELEQRELTLVTRLMEGLQGETPLRNQEIAADEAKLISGYVLLTNKPVVVAVNLGEADAARVGEVQAEFAERYGGDRVEAVALCGKLEQELSELSPDEAAEFRTDMGIEQDGVAGLVQATQRSMGMHVFFTVGEPEGRAWPLPVGGTALDAAGRIHSDIARGFIRAEVVGWRELLDCGSLAEARKRGLLRTEGKQYVVQDGDVMHILFNV